MGLDKGEKTAMIGKYDFFWNTMELCDWKKEGDDDQVLKPVIQYLSKQDDHVIFEFDDLMTELLYHLDTKKLAKQCEKVDPLMSDDTFLYSRCVALINGSAYYPKSRIICTQNTTPKVRPASPETFGLSA